MRLFLPKDRWLTDSFLSETKYPEILANPFPGQPLVIPLVPGRVYIIFAIYLSNMIVISLSNIVNSFMFVILNRHPDKNKSPKAQDVFMKITEAYDVRIDDSVNFLGNSQLPHQDFS